MNRLSSEDLEHVLLYTDGLWEDLRGERIFITGGTGFFGRWILESFRHASARFALQARVVVLTRSPQRFVEEAPWLGRDPAIELCAGDVRSFVFPSGRFAGIIHAATETDSLTSPIDRSALFDANTEGTRRVLDFARTCGASRILFTSSGAVYGTQAPALSRLREDCLTAPDPLDVSKAYGHSKRASEFLCAAHARRYGQSVTIARCFAFVGPHLALDQNYAIGNFIRDAMQGGPIRIEGDGTPLRSYLYAADLAAWLWRILLRGDSGRAYNVGSDVAISIGELARLVAEVVDPRLEVTIAQRPVAGRLPARYVPAIDRARSELGLEAWVQLRDAIARTVCWHRAS